MSTRRKTVRTWQPPAVERFDDQFWPVLMALCITATVLAATVVTLMAGFWMWVSLLILPAALTVLLVTLRLVDNRRWRRSFQLAVILSLAAHCAFIIFAARTDVFAGFFLRVDREPTAVQPPRVIHIARQVDNPRWLEENPVPAPDTAEPLADRQSVVDTSTARPLAPRVNSQTPSENPRLVRRQQPNQTVPRSGKSLSRPRRQTEDRQPAASQEAPVATATNANRSPAAADLESPVTGLTRRSDDQATATVRSRHTPDSDATARPAEMTRNPDRSRPGLAASERTWPRRATESPRVEEAAPRRQLRALAAAPQPDTSATGQPTEASSPDRRSGNSSSSATARVQREQPAPEPLAQQPPTVPNLQRELPAIASRQPTTNRSRSEVAAPEAVTPEVMERPRPANDGTRDTRLAEPATQPMALDRATAGIAGVGRSANFDRHSPARQSPALTPSDSMRRRNDTTRRNNPDSISLRQMAREPRAAAGAEIAGIVNRPDAIPVASRPADSAPAELTDTASATLTQSDAEAVRGESSVARGSGSVDLGPTRIVSDLTGQRVEGGGQPEIRQKAGTPTRLAPSDRSSAAPRLLAENIDRLSAEPTPGTSEARVAEPLVDAAAAEVLTRSGENIADSPQLRPDRLAAATAKIDDDGPARVNDDADSPRDEDEEARQRRQAADLARRTRRSEGLETPAFAAGIDPLATASDASNESDGESPVQAVPTDLARRSGSNHSDDAAVRRPNRDAAVSADGDIASGLTSSRAAGSETGPSLTARSRITRPRATTDAAAGLLLVDDQPRATGRVREALGQSSLLSAEDRLATLDRQSPPGVGLNIDAPRGASGISNQPEMDPGIESRRASRSSPAIQSLSETRFRREDTRGAPSISAAPVIAREAFRSRNQPSRSRSAPRTEESIERGLAFLARQQQEDGSWSLHGIPQDLTANAQRLSSDTAATGLALLAFQGAGYNHREFKYATQLQAAVQWLIDHQQITGELYISGDPYSDSVCRFYSHGIATLALAEAYGMTQDEDLRLPVQLALDFITDTQHERLGGWRYRPGIESDTSVTGWMMMALQSGRLAQLETDEKTWTGIRQWLQMARAPDREFLFRYNPQAHDRPETRHGRQASPCMTAVGLLMHLYLGRDRNDPRFSEGADYLLQNLPDDSTIASRDTYYWYYATQIIRHLGGEAWERWHGALHPLLVQSQVRDGELSGSWDPLNPVPDRWGAQAGRLYVTTMNLLSLEVDYRLLPLHEDTVR
jgi:hypothetical protein